MKIERRKFSRHRLPINGLFFYSNDPSIHGWIKDISLGGTAFEYAPTGDCEIEQKITVTLMADKFPFYLPDIPCKIIYDVDNDCSIFGGSKTRCCGVQYEKFDPEIQERLEDLLSSKHIMSGT